MNIIQHSHAVDLVRNISQFQSYHLLGRYKRVDHTIEDVEENYIVDEVFLEIANFHWT